ncbi:hypothetical protein BDV96DRAFT_623661 [Lophiotrema nucula]|uniref:C2H2-type domain-containing protein n=1 Tax=Lophiotrema nucula TaxID=690887 RepID=A0A6A5YWT1_9PLEO|nr:hypothetical protein BDV96DRAFT_623661 [Lophiotrema nucula]
MAPSTTPSLDLLYEAIDTTSVDRLREFVRELCASSETGRKHFSDRLLLSEPIADNAPMAEDKENEPTEGGASTSQKRKRTEEYTVQQRYEMCTQCETEYDVSTNSSTSCVWHDGYTEPDYDGDFWADPDEDCHGTIDTDDMREEFPEGFVWNCCDAEGDARGCQTGEHRPRKVKKVRTSLIGARNMMSIAALT